MRDNIGASDRALRLAAGGLLAITGLAVFGGLLNLGALTGGLALMFGAVLVGTGLTRLCPLYKIIGVDTCDI